ncbi:MAG TPA: anaerobic ribonucleoside-triphosphate reductase activating protein, partial [Armatimonadota bacterium]|nr:anaerobic ribonucleoside-triphosphate reductase activating protein [Armatimonadota bacterium]
AMDVKAPWDKYDLLSGVPAPREAVRESMHLIIGSGLPHAFRTTAVPALLTDDDLTTMREMLPPQSPYHVQPFRAAQALDPCLRQPVQ